MASVTMSPGAAVDDDSVGTKAWTVGDPDNAKVSDDVYAKAVAIERFVSAADAEVKLVKSDGSIGIENKAKTGVWPSSDEYFSYGASDDLWSETWSASDINDSDFGVVLSVWEDGNAYTKTHYLKVTNFGFDIPSNATVTGIAVEIEKHQESPLGWTTPYVDHIQVIVYYDFYHSEKGPGSVGTEEMVSPYFGSNWFNPSNALTEDGAYAFAEAGSDSIGGPT